MLLQAFGVGQATIDIVQAQLRPVPITTSATAMPATVAPQQTPAPQTTLAPQPNGASTAPVLAATAPVASLGHIGIIEPMGGKGIHNRASQISTSTAFDERGQPMNEVSIAAVIYGANGLPLPTDDHMVPMAITATDASQNLVLKGTGAGVTVYVDGYPRGALMYMYTYEVRTAGDHTITFSANDMSTSTTFTAK